MTQITNQPTQAGYVSFDTFNGCFPKEGPRAIPIIVDFDGSDNQEINFLGQIERHKISMVQGVYIDNSQNTGTVSIAANATRQLITIQPGCQGYFPILVNNPPVFILSSSAAAIVGFQFFNFPISPLQWGPQSGGGSSVDLTAGNGIVLTPSPITGTGVIAAVVDGTTIGFNGGGAIQSLIIAPTSANPSATAGPAAVNGSATTFMRSDAAPAIQLGSATQKGIVEVDNVTIGASAGVIATNPPLVSNQTKGNPTNTTSTSGVMCGLAFSYTPVKSGFCLINVTWQYEQTVSGANFGISNTLQTGTGTAPANGVAITGTQLGALINSTVQLATIQLSIFVGAQLTVGVAHWFDLSYTAYTGGSVFVLNPGITIVEI